MERKAAGRIGLSTERVKIRKIIRKNEANITGHPGLVYKLMFSPSKFVFSILVSV